MNGDWHAGANSTSSGAGRRSGRGEVLISHPVFHDFVKSLLHREYEQVYNICSGVPTLNSSNLFRKNVYALSNADQEVMMNPRFRYVGKADALWIFTSTRETYPQHERYIVLHEVKTGAYDIEEVYRKYYSEPISNGQIWIWAWNIHHERNNPTDKKIVRSVRQPAIELLEPLCVAYLDWFMMKLGARGEVM